MNILAIRRSAIRFPALWGTRNDLNGTRTFITGALRRMLGYEPEELVGKETVLVVHPGDRAGPLAAMATQTTERPWMALGRTMIFVHSEEVGATLDFALGLLLSHQSDADRRLELS